MDERPQTPHTPRTIAPVSYITSDPAPRNDPFEFHETDDDYGSSSNKDPNDNEEMHKKQTAKETMSKLMNGKDKEWAAVVDKPGPLRLLDLPVDVLKEIVKEVTHTNDLTALALTHSALHRLAIPHIYSRFDIVWPDSETHAEPRSGVDALTYGLATLVFAEDVFGEAPSQNPQSQASQPSACTHCGHISQPNPNPETHLTQSHQLAKRKRRGNHYAEYTRKFSLGNGPPDWVKEYMITKEGGKMLGTLVALAIARMKNLETFVWDMPTGVLRDVWIALSSLGERSDGHDCRLEKIWIRWHNNDEQLQGIAVPTTAASVPHPLFGNTAPLGSNSHAVPPVTPAAGPPISYLDRVERPTFSILPPLKSLTVLDIDELAYLDEMSTLVGKSRKRLRELRVGIATHVTTKDWVAAWQGDGAEHWDTHSFSGSSVRGERRVGGVIGTLVSQCFDEKDCECSQCKIGCSEQSILPHRPREDILGSAPPPAAIVALKTDISPAPKFVEELSPVDNTSSAKDVVSIPSIIYPETEQASPNPQTLVDEDKAVTSYQSHRTKVFHMLSLQVLELERVPLSVRVLGTSIDWMKLTDLTLLSCQNHEQLWKILRRTFAPLPPSSPGGSPSKNGSTDASPLQYCLNLRKIQTDQVSAPLITFLKETLAPNTLEVLFLQQNGAYNSTVTIDSIYRGPIRRHRTSLQKILIDSSERSEDGRVTANPRWSLWMLTREIVGFITSGKMPNLKEIGASIDYRDWHFFLQRLPSIPHIRSLYIPFVGDHAHGSNLDPRELALQIVDIVTLCPEIELCYVGILTKCFEILEGKMGDYDIRLPELEDALQHSATHGHTAADDDDDDDDEAGDDEDGDDGDDDEAGDGEGTEDEDAESNEDCGRDDDDDSASEGDSGAKVHLRLREILFYDDKVAVFKARHGKL